MLIQTKQAIEALKKAGFKRSEFRVQAERHIFTRSGRRCVEYGSANITIWSKLSRQLELVPQMLEAGLSVTMLKKRDGSDGYPLVRNDGRGELSEFQAK